MDEKIIAFESKFDKPKKFNSQFHMVKVYVAYAGKNRNGSIISKETFEKIKPSLYGVPIVGEWKGEDFGSHGGKIEISEDGVEYIDTTKPYGFVDSSADVQWEKVKEEDGTEREYLTTTAFLWTERYPEALRVLENKNNQSMELNVFDIKESEEHEGYFEILDGEFSALCILGESVEPCFESAKVSQFNLDKDTFKAEFTQMVKELKNSMGFNKESQTEKGTEGGEDMKDEKFEEEVVEETSEEGTEKDTEESVKEGQSDKTDDKKVADNTDEDEVFTKTFELSHDDIRCKLYKLLHEIEKEDDNYYYIDEVYDDYFIYSSWDETPKHYKQNYIKTDIDVAFEGERVEMFVEFLTAKELEELNKMRDNYSLILKENEKLKDFKAQKEKEEFEAEQERAKQEKIKHINIEYANLPKDIKEMFISKVDEYESTEDIDADICVYIVKNKLSFAKANKSQPKSIKVGIEDKEQTLEVSPYGDLF